MADYQDEAEVFARRVAKGDFGSALPSPVKLGQGFLDTTYVLAMRLGRPGPPKYTSNANEYNAFGLANALFKLIGVPGGGGNPAPTPLAVAYAAGAWDKTPAQISAARDAGQTVTWQGTTVLPTPADGLAEGDAVSGTFSQPEPTRPLAKISFPDWAIPTVVDADQSANDKVALEWISYMGLTYTVNGVDYASGEQVSTGGAASVPVSIKVKKPDRFAILEPTTAWTLNFNTTDTWITSIGSAPTAQDRANTASDTITITSAPGVIWTVDGVDYPSSGFAGTKVIPYTKGVNTTVTARAATGYQIAPGVTTSWPLQFTSAA